MAGKEGVENKTGYKIANVIEEKSWIVGGLALVGSLVVPALIAVVGWEGLQIVGAETYKRRVKTKKMTPGKQYSLAA